MFDQHGCIKKYTDVCDILKDFYELRLHMYIRRKDYLEGILEAESSKLNNQARFIMEKIEGTIVIGKLKDPNQKVLLDFEEKKSTKLITKKGFYS